MNRLRLIDIRNSRIPEAIGCCPTSTDPKLVTVLNEAQDRLVLAGGETGWWGGWSRMVFNVNRSDNPYITCPRDVARLIDIDVCTYPVPIQNEFYEFLEAGSGLQAPGGCVNSCSVPQGYDRGVFPSFLDMSPGDVLRVYLTDLRDIGKKVLVQGDDTNNMTIYSDDGSVQTLGTYVTLASPFVDTTMALNRLTGIQKDITFGPVMIWSANLLTGDQTLILTMQPGEQTASYRRYFLNGMPKNCCNPPGDSTTFQVTALAKMDLIPVKVDTDYLLIQSIPALKHECMAVRYSEMDTPSAAGLEVGNHKLAIRLLNGQLVHQLGKQKPAINFAPFGTATLRRAAVGTLT